MNNTTISRKNLLVEIGTEELPPTALSRLSEHFCQGIIEQLEKLQLTHEGFEAFATPRRLGILVKNLQTRQANQRLKRKGPSVKAAFDTAGNPTKATLGFARSCNTTVDQLGREKTDKGEWLSYQVNIPGKETAELLPTIITTALDKLPIPKRMHWADLDVLFVRPVHWLLVLLGHSPIDCQLLGVKSGNKTYGHRFHHPKAIEIQDPLEYEQCLLEQGKVIANFQQRREKIHQQIIALAGKHQAEAVIDNDLLDEVTAMVEWPVAISGSFDQEFLQVPAQALISAMKKHQKYFHLLDQNGQLLPRFITIANIESSKPEYIQQGNERVIRPRLSDASFFWNQDLKQPLDKQVERLRTVVFQNKLGSLFDKTQRVIRLSHYLASLWQVDTRLAERAAWLGKADLMSEMINEFPDLQGIMGRYYALHQGEEEAVAIAIDEQYLPRYSGDRVSQNPYAQILAIADKLDSIYGIFAIGMAPTGDKDPFALRRASLGILRTLVENQKDVDLCDLLQQLAQIYPKAISSLANSEQMIQFINDRFKGYILDQGYRYDIFDAVVSISSCNPHDMLLRIQAVDNFLKLPQATALAAANKRIANILKKNRQDLPAETDVNAALFSETAEQHLYQAMQGLEQQLKQQYEKRDYNGCLISLATLDQAVDQFFDSVMVMVEDTAIKTNRMALIAKLHQQFSQIADLSRITTT